MADTKQPQHSLAWDGAFSAALGLWLALALLKLGTPVILDAQTPAPQSLIEALVASWPMRWGYVLLVPVVALGLRTAHWTLPRPRWLVLLPLVWLAWQFLSAAQSVEPKLSWPTVWHFSVCVVAFYLGMFCLGPALNLRPFWLAVLGGFGVVLVFGWHQHFIGLEETRRFFYAQPNWRDYAPEFLQKVASDRIYATLFYPNALAGVILLLTPAWLHGLWSAFASSRAALRWSVVGLGMVAVAACLAWSGSKAGWLIFVGMGLLALAHSPLLVRTRLAIGSVVVVLAIGAFLARHSGYFAKGATSVSARGAYWKAGVSLTLERPLLGSGPGTFMVGYKRVKAPGAEMARLAHNDYLQQASDSGIPGFLLFSAMLAGLIAQLYRHSRPGASAAMLPVWLGLSGYAAQSCVEFPLYIPALAWPFFVLAGWLFSQSCTGKPFDKAAPSRYAPHPP